MRTGIATMTLDYGQCPAWLFARMTRLGRVIALVIISEFVGKDGTLYPVDKVTYDKTLTVLENAVRRSSLYLKEKNSTMQKNDSLY